MAMVGNVGIVPTVIETVSLLQHCVTVT